MAFDLKTGAWIVATRDKVELRVEIPRDIANVLDGFSLAQDKKRTELVNEILEDWARRRVHEWNLLGRVAGLHPVASDALRGAPSIAACEE